jgi:two-component system, cell cycle sensor histidine kinase and response regulator CckA
MLQQVLLESACALTLKISPEPLHICADQLGIQRVLINLVINARDAMPHGGRLAIGTSRTASGSCQLSVEDTGIGMDEETRRRIFEPFFSLKARSGAGLGMTIVEGIVSRIGGTIELESEAGRGTQFRVVFPPAPAGNKTASGARQATGTILLVGNNQHVRPFLRTAFEHAGFDTLHASSGEKALKLLQSSRDSIEVLVTDVKMTGMTGPDLAKRWLHRFRHTRVLFVSGPSGEAFSSDLLQSGRADFIARPFTPKELVAKVQAIIRDHV